MENRIRNSLNRNLNEYRILQIDKEFGLKKIIFFNEIAARPLMRKDLNAPNHTFSLYPYKFYWFFCLLWFFNRNISLINIKITNRIKRLSLLEKIVSVLSIIVSLIIIYQFFINQNKN